MRFRIYLLFAFAAIIICPVASVSQTAPPSTISININSGNPAFPFPQFLPYVHPTGDTLHNLGTLALSSHDDARIAAAGITHAEMEKSIRDAYRIMMNRALYVPVRGVTNVGGTRYIRFVSKCGDYNYNSVAEGGCSEGDGYAMIAAAMMGDKVTFDGLWLYVHDHRMNNVVRYGDGTSTPPYRYSSLPTVYAGANGNEDSAADGDFDIALGLMIAHMQWGDNMGINDSRGNPISYKNDFIKFIRAITDTLINTEALPDRELLTGNIGFDGYFRGGNTWGEFTRWAASRSNLESIGVMNTNRVYQPSGTLQYIDYTAQAYFRQFAEYLRREPNSSSAYGWNISQYERAAASSDWLFAKHHEQRPDNIPFAGTVTKGGAGDTTVTFGNLQEGEDFRAPWRTVLDYVWHGNPTYSWDPIRHRVVRERPNTHMRDAGNRMARWLWDRRQAPWNQGCERIIGEGLWWGPSMLKYFYTPQGTNPNAFPLNWVHGTGAPSAVTSQNFNLMAEMYRQAEITWDAIAIGDGYITSMPDYFHGFFRLLGMMVMTGNHHAPLNMVRQANMKVYLDVDKTYAFENDEITYTIDYRNYGSVDGQNVVITNRLHSDFVFIEAPGGAFNPATNTVTWNIGTVPGFRTQTGIGPTRGTVTLKVAIPQANHKRYENRVQITCSNGTGWTSNEYPNVISSVMKRNGVDIARRALRVNKSVFRDTINPGMNATFTIDFENSTEAGWMNGGRPGVNFSYAHTTTTPTRSDHTFLIRAFHDAHESYIDYSNYRISYFMFDNTYTSLCATQMCATGWSAPADIVAPTSLVAGVRDGLRHEMITPGQDEKGRWNQRLILQLGDPESPTHSDTNWATMSAPTQFITNYYGGLGRYIHRGVDAPLRITWRMFAGMYFNRTWDNDWSYNPRAIGIVNNDLMANWGHPISPDFTASYAPDYQGTPVRTRHRKLCEPDAAVTVDNILIEEWDGYTWRRVAGNGPLPGREVVNVRIIDTIPAGVKFQRFLEPLPFGIMPTINADSTVIIWTIPKLLVGEKGSIKYSVNADPLPEGQTSRTIRSRAWAIADRESPLPNTAVLVVTTNELPPLPPPPTTMYKRADKEAYQEADTINYTVTYKQTHGFPVKSGARSEWTGTGTDRVNATGDTITLGAPTDMYHNLTYGTNGVLTGTARPQPDQASVFIFARSDPSNSSRRVELEFSSNYQGVNVTIRSNNQPPFTIPSAFGRDSDDSFNYKLIFQNDSLLIWIRDTSSALPTYVHRGIPVQAGYAGVKSTPNWPVGIWLRNWASHFDVAYNVTIRDTIPRGIRLIESSVTGTLHTTPPRPLTHTIAPIANDRHVITWPVPGTGPRNALNPNDSLTITFRAVVDTAWNRLIINTAYADLDNFPRDSIGAQLRSRFFIPGDTTIIDTTIIDTTKIDTTIVNPPQKGLRVIPNPLSCIYSRPITVSLTAFVDDNPAPNAVIYYTRNGREPEPGGQGSIRYDGQPLEFNNEFTTPNVLMAMAVLNDFEESSAVRQIYEPLITATVIYGSAFYFDKDEDGFAHGVKMRLSPSRMPGHPNLDVVFRHIDQLVDVTGSPGYDSIRVYGDTLALYFKGNGIEVPTDNPRLVIRIPDLPGDVYTSAHGYLGANDMPIMDGTAEKEPPPPPTRYSISLGPNPFPATITGVRYDTLNIFIASLPFKEIFDVRIMIYDRMGNIIATTDDNIINAGIDYSQTGIPARHKYTWTGINRRGRITGKGTYLVHVVVTEPVDPRSDKKPERRTFRQLVYFRGR
ncbi:MAG: glycosyl hydrolase family 8 [Chitinispirillia bacterium]|nr:glycosyl hydrolase family 8 [Chitinispirillia bacterium]